MCQAFQEEKALRVLMVTPEYPPFCGGIGWYVFNLSQNMASRGHKVTILQRGLDPQSHYGPFKIYYRNVGIIPYLNAVKIIKDIKQFLRDQPHDVAIVHSTTIGAWIKDLPTILLSHALFAEAKNSIYKGARDLNSLLHVIFSKIYKETERRSIHGADFVAVVSHAMRKEVLHHYGKEAVYVGNAVDTHAFHPIHAKSKDNKSVFLPSLLRPQKGIPMAVKVMKILKDRGCDITFRFINKGSMKNELMQGIQRNGLSHVEWLDPVDHSELPKIYQDSSIIFLPSVYEGLPNICLEAMACGLPVVATDVGGTREAVIHGETGYIHKVDDAEGMAESIYRLGQNDELRWRFGQNGMNAISEHYTWKKVGERWQKLLETVI